MKTKVWPSSGSEEEQREGILRMLKELDIDTSDAPASGLLREYAAAKEQQKWDAAHAECSDMRGESTPKLSQ